MLRVFVLKNQLVITFRKVNKNKKVKVDPFSLQPDLRIILV